MKRINTIKGFSLIEIIVVMAIIGIIMSIGLMFDFNSFKGYYFRSERATLVSILERARSRAMNNYYGTSHGVCFISPNYIIFKGSTCTSGSPDNELIPANQKIYTSSNFSSTFPTIVFSQLTGTTTGGTIHITDGLRSGDITINNEGTINW